MEGGRISKSVQYLMVWSEVEDQIMGLLTINLSVDLAIIRIVPKLNPCRPISILERLRLLAMTKFHLTKARKLKVAMRLADSCLFFPFCCHFHAN